MNRQRLFIYAYLAAGLIVLAILIVLAVASPPALPQLLPAVLFCGLIVFTDTFGVRLPAGVVSLLPMTAVAAYLVTGLVPAGWAAFVGTFIYGWIRARWAEALNFPPPRDRLRFLSLLAVNATMHAGSVLAGGAIFQALGGAFPLEAFTTSDLLPLVALGLVYLAFNHLVATIVIGTRSRRELKGYIKSLPRLLFYEGVPLIFAPLVALIYTQLGVLQFVLFAALIVIASLITRSLAMTSQRLERRVKELSSLQAVGRVLSSSLNIDTILSEIFTQVSDLMPAQNFYVALYEPGTDEVTFPLAYADGERVEWRSRRAGAGLTEYVLHTRQPLLIRSDVAATLERIGVEQIGEPAASWLGVPILAEQEPIGVIAVQSYSTSGAYDLSHQEVLSTIAAQAAVAIQNARLYERTDEALARRVQELASVLRTTGDGILLVDAEYRVLAANRALASYLGIAQAEIAYRHLGTIDLEGDRSLLALIGFKNLSSLERVCTEVSEDDVHHEQIVVVPGPPERHLERTLTPVRDSDGVTTGWLLVFRDISEELELARLREDMTHMLIHDLRSPLTVLRGSLDMMELAIEENNLENVRLLEQMARRGSDRMLRMVNELLDISKLESGEIPLDPEPVKPESLLREIATRLGPLAREADIELDLKTAQRLPDLHVDVKFMERVLHNLVDNAIKFTPDYGAVQLWAKADPERGDALLLGVADTGPGIPPEEQPRLFEKFQRTSITGRRVGTGLGLPFCKLAVEAHGGQIWIESEEGQGSTFIMRLPTVEEHDRRRGHAREK
jgi:signal transduction histidine kinase